MTDGKLKLLLLLTVTVSTACICAVVQRGLAPAARPVFDRSEPQPGRHTAHCTLLSFSFPPAAVWPWAVSARILLKKTAAKTIFISILFIFVQLSGPELGSVSAAPWRALGPPMHVLVHTLSQTNAIDNDHTAQYLQWEPLIAVFAMIDSLQKHTSNQLVLYTVNSYRPYPIFGSMVKKNQKNTNIQKKKY